MRFLSILAFVLCGLTVELNQACASLAVESGPFFRDGHTYYLLEVGSWTASEESAVSLGGHLVTINDAAENQWILDTFTGTVTGGYWIGLTDSALEGTFVWTSGEAVTYTNWDTGEPNDSAGEDYTMLRSGGGKWNDVSNSPTNQGTLKGIVELDSAVPEPTTLAIWSVFGGIWLVARHQRRRRKRA